MRLTAAFVALQLLVAGHRPTQGTQGQQPARLSQASAPMVSALSGTGSKPNSGAGEALDPAVAAMPEIRSSGARALIPLASGALLAGGAFSHQSNGTLTK